MSTEAMLAKLTALGLRKAFRLDEDNESEALLLKTRRHVETDGGLLSGSEIALFGADTFLIWTPQKTKAAAVARAHQLKIRLLTGEAELFVPEKLADAILPLFGAKTRPDLSPKEKSALVERLKRGGDRAAAPDSKPGSRSGKAGPSVKERASSASPDPNPAQSGTASPPVKDENPESDDSADFDLGAIDMSEIVVSKGNDAGPDQVGPARADSDEWAAPIDMAEIVVRSGDDAGCDEAGPAR